MERFINAARWIFGGRAQRSLYVQFIIWGVLGVGAAVLWLDLKPKIMSEPEYLIRSENVLICDPPAWISDDFVAEALKNLPLNKKLDSLNALDPDLIDVLTVAFAAHPWVAKVEKIDVFYPAQIKIRLKFRQPALIVDPTLSVITKFHQNLDKYSNFNENFLKTLNMSELLAKDSNTKPYVVDETGYRLPDEYLNNNANAYDELPILYGIYWGSSAAPGFPLDVYVADSALFASFLASCDALKKLEIEQIYILRKYGQTRGVYFLRTKDNSICLWGYFALDRETRIDETYSGERNAPNWEESKKKLYKEQQVKLERWSKAYKEASRQTTNETKRTSEPTTTEERQKTVYFCVAPEEELDD